MPFLIKS